MTDNNTNLVLIGGKSASGKSMSLMNLTDPTGVIYLNCEGKKLPFKHAFEEYRITEPYQMYDAFPYAKNKKDCHTIVIDTLTYLMDMYESLHVLPKAGTKQGQQAWGEYAQFFKILMFNHVAKSTKNCIFLAHTSDLYNESELVTETKVKVKGQLMNQGIESYFSTVVGTKKVTTESLEDYSSNLLTLTEKEKRLGIKYVYQTDITKTTINERIRSPLGMWEEAETFINNDVQLVIDRLHKYYT